MKKLLVLLITGVALLVIALPMAAAQETSRSVTVTEERINEVFWVTNPANRNLSNVNVDLQAENGGQVTISALYTWRSRAGAQSTTLGVVLTPRLSNGRLFWDVESITADGTEASSELVAQVNRHLSATWRRWVAGNLPAGVLTAVTITDDDITYIYTPR